MNRESPATVDAKQEIARDQSARVMRVLEDYLAGLERGDPPDPEQLLAAHPDLAEPLRAYLASLEFLHTAAMNFRAPSQSEQPAPPSPPPSEDRRLGDYRILREVGRGGMGVVYEAEQISLGRRVALKVLPFAAVMDPRQLARFKTEAQAAAHLQHQNIVPVYGVGCERGVHYYAMQFIEGQSLAEVVAQLRKIEGMDGARGQGSGVRDQGSGTSNPSRVRKRADKCPGIRGQGSATVLSFVNSWFSNHF